MRGLAAICVVTRHTELYWGGVRLFHSYLAVDLFFILSGFVLSHAYGQKLRRGTMSIWQFMLTRWIRLYPLYFLAALLGFGIAATLPHQYFGKVDVSMAAMAASLALTLLFLPSRVPRSEGLFPLNGPFWSLCFEVLLNAVYGLIHRWLTLRFLLLGVGLLGLGVGALAIYHGGLDLGYSWSGRSIAGGLLRASFGTFLGVLLHRLYQRRSPRPSQGFNPWFSVAAAIAALMLPQVTGFDLTIDLLTVFVVFPACVYAGACARSDPRPFGMLSLLGIASYPMYLLHMPLSIMLSGLLVSPRMPPAPIAGIALLLLLLGTSLAVDRFYDRPTRFILGSIKLRRQAA